MSFQDHVVPPVYSSQTAVEVHLDIQRYTRKTFDVDAVLITEENLANVVLWCDGKMDVSDASDPVVIIETKDKTNKKPDRILYGNVGDWILKIPTTGKNKFAWAIYKAYAFQRAFDRSTEGVIENALMTNGDVSFKSKAYPTAFKVEDLSFQDLVNELLLSRMRTHYLKGLVMEQLDKDVVTLEHGI
jgi:hypothetical protein